MPTTSRSGIFVDSGSGNGIFGGSIYDNGTLGIDLAPGANLNQAAPVLGTVQTGGSSIQVTGTLTSTPKKTFTIEFFASVANGGDGENYLGSALVDDRCQWAGGVQCDAAVAAGRGDVSSRRRRRMRAIILRSIRRRFLSGGGG